MLLRDAEGSDIAAVSRLSVGSAGASLCLAASPLPVLAHTEQAQHPVLQRASHLSTPWLIVRPTLQQLPPSPAVEQVMDFKYWIF